MSKYILAISLSLLMTACTTAVSPTYTATGDSGYRLTCGGLFGDGDLGSCYEKAGQLCGTNGYRVQQSSVSSLIIACREDQTPGVAEATK